MKMRTAVLALIAALAMPAAVVAGEQVDDTLIAGKAARVETVRARLSTVPSSSASATLIEAESLLRQLRAAPPSKRGAIAAQLDAALTRAELEMDAASRR